MNKTELVNAVLAKNGKDFQSKAAAERAVEAVFDTVAEEMAKGNEVTLVGFGTFKTAKRAARTARNPQTGKAVKVQAKTVPTFKAGKALKEKVNKK